MKSIVGYTGFVGSNICLSTDFDEYYNSKNIQDSYGSKPDVLVYSGVRAEKFLANKNPVKDYEIVLNAINNIKKIAPQKIVLISTIDVYKNPYMVNEETKIDTVDLQPYGFNRYHLENWVESNFKEYLIVRLPGLYGTNLKKNFLFDLINIIPSMLKEEKFLEVSKNNSFISDFYKKSDNGFYKCVELNSSERNMLKEFFLELGFSALNFTDSRASFQFYNLKYLWDHISIAMENGIKRLNLATEPVKIEEIYKKIMESDFKNEITDNPPMYNFKTKYAELFSGSDGYIFNKEFVLNDINNYVKGYINETVNI